MFKFSLVFIIQTIFRSLDDYFYIRGFFGLFECLLSVFKWKPIRDQGFQTYLPSQNHFHSNGVAKKKI